MRVIGAAESAVSRHDRMVRAEMMQAERVRSTAGVPADFWETLARQFRAPADPAADPTPDALAALIGPDDRAIDVGAGGGRIAIPLSRRCREVVAVEPSPAMRAVLAEEISRHGVGNIRIVVARWEELTGRSGASKTRPTSRPRVAPSSRAFSMVPRGYGLASPPQPIMNIACAPGNRS